MVDCNAGENTMRSDARPTEEMIKSVIDRPEK